MRFAILLGCLLTSMVSNAQDIFTFGNTSVSKEEFLRMYTKNNMSKKADMSEKALREYITLYSRFKMKVAEAEAKRIDTLPAIQSELTTYKKQLSKSFLTDKDVLNTLSKETYDRMAKEIEVAHIMVAVPRGADEKVYKMKIDSINNLIKNKTATFEQLAVQSDDKSSAIKGGNIGYVTALQIPYEFELAAYNLKNGATSGPVKTSFGYHIIKKLNERKNRGEVQVSQILCIAQKTAGEVGKAAAKGRMDSVKAGINAGIDWNDLVKQFSQDKFSVNNDGILEPFGVGKMNATFEEAAFNLKKEGDISQVIETEFGYHIMKLIKKMPFKNYEDLKSELVRRIEKDNRIEVAKQTFMNKIKVKNGFNESPNAAMLFSNLIPDSMAQNNTIKIPENYTSNPTLFVLKGKNYTVRDLAQNIRQSTRGVLYGVKNLAIENAYKSFAEKSILDVEEANLEVENKEYANLLKEYRDGIILFDLTDKSVWNKASTDSLGLETYFAKNKSKYIWGPSFEGKQMRCSDAAVARLLTDALKLGKSVDEATTIADSTGAKISTETAKYEFDKIDASLKSLVAKIPSAMIKNSDNTYSIYLADKINMQSEPKTLNEARGYVIADYQDYLEKEWIANMELKYPVKINESLLKSLIN
jgi:peptidyl-prolyl cis-trans isomerase SurA